MNLEVFEQDIRTSSFSEHEEYLKSLITTNIKLVKRSNLTSLSKLGGNPLAPPNFSWPQHDFGYYRFIAQFDLSELVGEPTLLPNRGMLTFFVADDEEGNNFWGDDNYVKVYLFEDNDLEITQNPNLSYQPSIFVELKTSFDVPLKFDLRELDKSPLSDIQKNDFIYKFSHEVKEELHTLLGYPYYSSLAYDPRENENWISLLTLSSDEELGWNWHDWSFLMIFIEKERLESGDFSNIKSDAG